MNGIALRSARSENKRAANPHHIEFVKKSRVFIKAGQLFVKARFDFFQDGNKVANYETLSIGMQRDYSDLLAIKGQVNLIGQRLISARALTSAQCERLLQQQTKLKENGVLKRFGELAVEKGYCTEQEINQCLLAV